MNQEKADERPRYNYKESRERKKKFIRYKEGAEMYSMGLHTFMNLAKEAGAVHKYVPRSNCKNGRTVIRSQKSKFCWQ